MPGIDRSTRKRHGQPLRPWLTALDRHSIIPGMPSDTISLALAKKRLRERIEAGLNSGPGRPLAAERVAQLKGQAFGKRR